LLKDIENLQAEAKKSVIKTGFSKLDEKLGGGLHNGRLYGLGGISSLGKTTLALNIAENIATDEKDKDGNITKAGRNVLIFSLEMARTELLAKILSKRTFEPVLKKYPNENDFKKLEKEAVSLNDLYNNQEKAKTINKVIDNRLEETASRLNIMEGIGNITVDTVRSAVEKFIDENSPNLQPVVIIDFLQILSPLNERSTDKQIVDRNISELKRLTRDLDVAYTIQLFLSICCFALGDFLLHMQSRDQHSPSYSSSVLSSTSYPLSYYQFPASFRSQSKGS